MADDSRPVSSFLFCNDDGEPNHFFIRPSLTKAKLRQLIQDHGGVVSSRIDGTKDYIRLAAEGDKITSDDYFRVDYIHDCISANQRLPRENYRVQQEQQPQPSSPNCSVMSNVSVKGRSKYNNTEDTAIIAYIAQHPELSYAGNQIWKKMELLKVTDHSWQSMKYRFLKKLVDDFPGYAESHKETNGAADTTLKDKGRDAGDDLGASTSTVDQPATPETPSSKDQPQPMETTSNDCPDEPKSSSQSPSNEANGPVEIQDSSTSSDLDFDNDLIEAAEKDSPRKTGQTGESSQGTKESLQGTQEKSSYSDEEHSHKSRKRYLRDDKVTSSQSGVPGSPARELNKESTDDQTDGEMHSAKRRRKAKPPVTVADEDLVVGVMTDSDSESLGCVSEDEEDSEEICEVVSFVKKAMQDYSVSCKSVGQLLYNHSGDFDSVLEHLQTGRQPKDVPLWTKDDDEKLNSCLAKDIKDLCKKYGQESVMKRQAFFE